MTLRHKIALVYSILVHGIPPVDEVAPYEPDECERRALYEVSG